MRAACRWPRPALLLIRKLRRGGGGKLWAVDSAALGGCVRAWKLAEEEQELSVLNRDVVVAFSKCFASGYLPPFAPGTRRTLL